MPSTFNIQFNENVTVTKSVCQSNLGGRLYYISIDLVINKLVDDITWVRIGVLPNSIILPTTDILGIIRYTHGSYLNNFATILIKPEEIAVRAEGGKTIPSGSKLNINAMWLV